jgi:hypothetical protein
LKEYEVEGVRRSAAMAPLPAQRVTELLESHGELSHDWAEVEGLLQRLGPAWAQLRSILNELNAVVGRDGTAAPVVEVVSRRDGNCV